MELWQAAVLGLVEGITEYLPVSSTGHLIIASALMGLDDPGVKASVDAFTIVVQGGAILAVMGLYAGRVKQMVLGLLGRDRAGLTLLVNLMVAFIPAGVLGKLLDDAIESYLFYVGPVVAALMLGGVYMMVVDLWYQGRLWRTPARRPGRTKEVTDLTLRESFLIGLLQCVAMWPGTSRSMMTITGGMFMGLRARQAAEFSFLLGLPTLGAATAYRMHQNLSESAERGVPNFVEQLGPVAVVVGITVAAVSAGVAVRWLVGFLARHGLAAFGWYRIGLGVGLLAMAGVGVVRVEPGVEAATPVSRETGSLTPGAPESATHGQPAESR